MPFYQFGSVRVSQIIATRDYGPETEPVWLVLELNLSVLLLFCQFQDCRVRGKEGKMAACWALKEKYRLWTLKLPLEAQSCLPFWHIVKKQMQQIRTYCSSGGIIRAFEPWASPLCFCPLSDKLTPSVCYSYYPSQSVSAICADTASVFVIWSLPSQNNMSSVCLLE